MLTEDCGILYYSCSGGGTVNMLEERKREKKKETSGPPPPSLMPSPSAVGRSVFYVPLGLSDKCRMEVDWQQKLSIKEVLN